MITFYLMFIVMCFYVCKNNKSAVNPFFYNESPPYIPPALNLNYNWYSAANCINDGYILPRYVKYSGKYRGYVTARFYNCFNKLTTRLPNHAKLL
jgi:hypothetical protein